MVVRGDPAEVRFSQKEPHGPMTDGEIQAYLHRKIEHALNQEDGELSEVRERLLGRYRGDALGKERPGFSKYRTREIYEMVEGAMPGLTSLFFSSKHPVMFRPRGPEDVEAAKQETEIVDYYLLRRPNAFMEIHHFLKQALVDPVSYAKVYCRHVRKSVHHKYAELSYTQLLALTEGGREWAKGTKIDEVSEPGVPEPLFSFEGEEIVEDPEFILKAVPPEQVLVEQNATDLDLDEVWDNYGFICHRTDETYTELLKRGYDKDKLNEAGGSNFEVRYNDERTNRQNREDERPDQSVVSDFSTRLFTVFECYIKMDVDGSGVAQSWKIVMIGNSIFEKEKVSYQPFVAMSGIPMPHKHAGISPAEAMEDLQELKTRLMRALLDNVYRSEDRKIHVDKNMMTAKTKAQYSNPQSSMVEWKGNPDAAIKEEAPNPIVQELLAALQYADDKTRSRTGMAPDAMLNPDVLRDATAHNLLGASDKSSGRLMHYGRIFAETGLRKIGSKFHMLLRMYQDKKTWIEVRGEFVEVSPSDWYERKDMTVAVGLGFNSKEQTLQALIQILGLQKEALTQGLATPMHLKHTLSMIVEYADLGFYDQYFVDPDPAKGWKPPPPPPNPQMEAVKVQREIAQLEAQAKKLQFETEERIAASKNEVENRKLDVDEGRIAADADLKEVGALSEAALIVEKRVAEIEEINAKRDKMRKELEVMEAQVAKIYADANVQRVEAKLAEEGEDDGDSSGREESQDS